MPELVQRRVCRAVSWWEEQDLPHSGDRELLQQLKRCCQPWPRSRVKLNPNLIIFCSIFNKVYPASCSKQNRFRPVIGWEKCEKERRAAGSGWSGWRNGALPFILSEERMWAGALQHLVFGWAAKRSLWPLVVNKDCFFGTSPKSSFIKCNVLAKF